MKENCDVKKGTREETFAMFLNGVSNNSVIEMFVGDSILSDTDVSRFLTALIEKSCKISLLFLGDSDEAGVLLKLSKIITVYVFDEDKFSKSANCMDIDFRETCDNFSFVQSQNPDLSITLFHDGGDFFPESEKHHPLCLSYKSWFDHYVGDFSKTLGEQP